MLAVACCVAAVNLFTAYRLSVTYSHGRLHAVINYMVLLFLLQQAILMGIIGVFSNMPGPLFIVVLGYAYTVAFGLLILTPVALLGTGLWYAMHFKALGRLKAMNRQRP